MKPFVQTLAVLILLIAFIIPQPSIAATREEMLTQINQLQSLIQELTEMLAVQQFRTDNENFEKSGCLYLTKYLYIGKDDEITGGDVSRLQAYLARDASVYPEGLVTGYFGEASARAVRRFQEKHEIVDGRDDEYGRVLDTTIAYLKQNCSQEESKTTFSNSEPIVTLVTPNSGVFDFQDDFVVIAHVYNTSSYGGSVSVSATGGHFGQSEFGMGAIEITPNYSGQVTIPIPKAKKNHFRIGEEYTLIVKAADKFFGQHTPNKDYSDGTIQFEGVRNALTFEEKNLCYSENHPCWSSVKPEYKPEVRVLETSAETINNGTQGVFTAEVEIEATSAGTIYIPEIANGISFGAKRTTGTTVYRFGSTVAERSVIDYHNSKKVEFEGETYYEIDSGEKARLTIQLTYKPEYEGDYYARINMIGYKVELDGTYFNFRPENILTPTDPVFIDGPVYDPSVENLG